MRRRQHLSLRDTFKGVIDNSPGGGISAETLIAFAATAWYYVVGVPECNPPKRGDD